VTVITACGSIIGGDSGAHVEDPRYAHRMMKPEWPRELVRQCRKANVAIWYKQGSGTKSGMHEELDSKLIQEWPATH
jgi:protein gp37